MRVSLMQASDNLTIDCFEWKCLVAAIKEARPDIFVTNEMPFGPWLAEGDVFDRKAAAESVKMHEYGLAALRALDVPVVLSSRPVPAEDRLANEAFILEGENYRVAHHKHYFPAESDFHENVWFRPGRSGFDALQAGTVKIGVLLCTELFFNEWARHYRRQGAQLIAVPRASGTTMEHWNTAAAMAAIVSGCYVVSSNRVGSSSSGLTFGGEGFAFAPDGSLLTRTSSSEPVMTFEFDPDRVATQQALYPCYVPELAAD